MCNGIGIGLEKDGEGRGGWWMEFVEIGEVDGVVDSIVDVWDLGVVR